MKKLISLIGIIISFFWVTPNSFAIFSDISATDPDIEAYNFVQVENIMTGSEDGNFHPELTLTRCELIKIALIASEVSVGSQVSSAFPDIPASHWCNPYAKVARDQGVINGYGDGTFQPNRKVTQIEALKILINSAMVTLPNVTSPKYADVRITDWWAPYIHYAQDTLYSDNPIYLREANTYGVNSEMLRAETAYLVWKLFSSPQSPMVSYPQIIGDTDCNNQSRLALDLLRTLSPSHFSFVRRYIGIIECVPTGSGMYVEESPPRYQAGQATRDAGTIWYASTMVHDACHSQQYQSYLQAHPSSTVPREVHFGREPEIECNTIQIAALRNLRASTETINYVQNNIDSEYWNNSERNW
ncbi:MAG: S-layer homology domain-containing protein [Candidatus Abawacabacteria bacterium]|nr:S-layer homology domain-containing protein [Candidatus Abawacabacteria bacterium]